MMKVLVVGIDTVKQKNLYQMEGLREYGVHFTVITTDASGLSQKVAAKSPNVSVIPISARWRRLGMLWETAKAASTRDFDLAELYPGSVLQLCCALVLRLFGLKLLIIARGEEYWYESGKMSVVRRAAFRSTYAAATAVLYKELYMEAMLDRFRIYRRVLLPNAVAIPEQFKRPPKEGCVFLFLNTFKFFRHPELAVSAFARLCAEFDLRSDSTTRLVLVGAPGVSSGEEFQSKGREVRALLAGQDLPVDIHEWSDSAIDWIEASHVFLLPADVVYVNYSLLEAMARGRPAIVQRSPGAELLVRDGVDGFIRQRDCEEWYLAMKTLYLSPELRERLGASARKWIEERYSYEAYLKRYNALYHELVRS